MKGRFIFRKGFYGKYVSKAHLDENACEGIFRVPIALKNIMGSSSNMNKIKQLTLLVWPYLDFFEFLRPRNSGYGTFLSCMSRIYPLLPDIISLSTQLVETNWHVQNLSDEKPR